MQQPPRPVQILHLPSHGIRRCALRGDGAPIPGSSTGVDPQLQSHLMKEQEKMLWTIFIILLVLWALGMVTSYTAGGLIHILLVIAVVVLLFRLFSGRRVV